jgi:hypothetical protein
MDVTPKVGMGVTVLHWTDRTPGTISRVSPSGKTFWYRNDDAKRIDNNGESESQEYEFFPVPEAPENKVQRRRKDGRWRDEIGHVISVGDRSKYRDPSF